MNVYNDELQTIIHSKAKCETSDDNSFDVFYYESGDGGAAYWGARYHIVKTSVENKIILNKMIEKF